jgi:hypothetical protein
VARIAALVLVAASLVAPAVTRAAAFTVTRPDDPPPNGCLPADCSLREAIIAANGAPGSTVTLPGGTFTLTRAGADTATTNASIGDLDILVAMTITGNGSTIVQAGTAKGAGIHRIFDVFSANPVTISRMTIRFGTDTEVKSGGCIKNAGVLTLDAVTVASCTSSIGGGGIASYKTLTVRDSTITDNSVTAPNRQVNGGGIANGSQASGAPATVTVIRAKILNNVARSTRPFIAIGGGFSNTGIMTIQDSLISGNLADSSAGGLSDPRFSNPDGSMTIERTTIAANKATRDAGGVTNDGVMTIRNTTFANNEAGFQCGGADCNQSFAGGLLSTAQATSNVSNSTFSGNICDLAGGGLLNSATATQTGRLNIASSTIVNNTCNLAAGIGGGQSGLTTLRNSIVANNASGPTGGDCGGKVASLAYNILRTTTGCALSGDLTGNITGTDPMVAALANNGGATSTHALLLGSPAVNAGAPAGCNDPAGTRLTTDQRGFSRHAMGRCDIGSYERQTSVALWTSSNAATIWQLSGSSLLGTNSLPGPGAGWTAQSYSRNPDGSFALLWSIDNAAQVWKYRGDFAFVSSASHTGPGAGWLATSVFSTLDGGYELLWTMNNTAQVWTIRPNGTSGPTLALTGPAGLRATSYSRANDLTRRVLWTATGVAKLWVLSAEGTFRSEQSVAGPTEPGSWTANTVNLNDDGTFNIGWASTDWRARIWLMNANGSFNSSISLTGPTGRTLQSYFFK